MVWVMGAGLVLALVMIVGMIGLIVVQGSATFWPRPIERVMLNSGQVLMGVPVQTDKEHQRRLYRVGNRDVQAEPFRWVDLKDVKSVEQPKSALMLERSEWGIWMGEAQSVILQDELLLSPEESKQAVPASVQTAYGEGRVERAVLGEEGGKVRVRQRTILADDAGGAMATLARVQPLAREHAAQIERLTRIDLGSINHDMESQRLKARKAEIEAQRAQQVHAPLLAWWGVGATVLLAAAGVWGVVRLEGSQSTRLSRRVGRSAARVGLAAVAAGALLFVALENPATRADMTPQALAAVRQATAERIATLQTQYQQVQARIAALQQEDQRLRAIVTEPAFGRFAPIRQSQPDEPMLVSQIVRIVPANQLSLAGKWGVYLSRWGEFLGGEPRNSNTEGGVFPVIFGTVVLTLLLSVLVVPLGVIAALYLREYARQGPLVSLIRIAVNNLAGVPSIVYGVFGVGFFAYTVGEFIDSGPHSPAPLVSWWWIIAGVGILAALAAGLSTLAKGSSSPKARYRIRALVMVGWIGAAALACGAIATSPYFSGFFREKLPSPTYGTGGILWSALTLALLTLPVVIVATEEAIAAVPRSVREGSYGCGASKWQTVRRVVLPQAVPGVMTGAILAMARGAGEVAPLMLVGAVKLAPALPFDREFPFVHPERSFMHLGFHIYDLGFQSPDSEAARPLVWTTTLLLVAIVLVMNLSAVIVRSRLRAKVVNASV
jgi:ABC-type phosphate transport system permease subunit